MSDLDRAHDQSLPRSLEISFGYLPSFRLLNFSFILHCIYIFIFKITGLGVIIYVTIICDSEFSKQKKMLDKIVVSIKYVTIINNYIYVYSQTVIKNNNIL